MMQTKQMAIVMALVFFADVIVFLIKPFGDSFFIVADLIVVLLAFLTFLLSVIAFRLHGLTSLQGKALLLLSVGMFLWFMGESIWAFYEIVLGIDAPTASLADVVWFAAYPVIVAGIIFAWKILQRPIRKEMPKAVLSLLIFLASSAAFLSFIFSEQGWTLETFVSSGYVLGDMVLILSSIGLVLSMAGGKLARPWMIIAAGLILTAVADMAYSLITYETGMWLDLFWDASYLLLAYGFFYYRQTFVSHMPAEGKK